MLQNSKNEAVIRLVIFTGCCTPPNKSLVQFAETLHFLVVFILEAQTAELHGSDRRLQVWAVGILHGAKVWGLESLKVYWI